MIAFLLLTGLLAAAAPADSARARASVVVPRPDSARAVTRAPASPAAATSSPARPASNIIPAFWQTRAERSGYRLTSDYDETMRFCRTLAAGTEWIKLESYG